MKLFLKRPRAGIDATAEYNVETGTFTVLKGSKVSTSIAHTEKFRGAKSIEKSRESTVKNYSVINDVVFKSSSTAANYVTGSSTNGMTAWKNEDGVTFKELFGNKEA